MRALCCAALRCSVLSWVRLSWTLELVFTSYWAPWQPEPLVCQSDPVTGKVCAVFCTEQQVRWKSIFQLKPVRLYKLNEVPSTVYRSCLEESLVPEWTGMPRSPRNSPIRLALTKPGNELMVQSTYICTSKASRFSTRPRIIAQSCNKAPTRQVRVFLDIRRKQLHRVTANPHNVSSPFSTLLSPILVSA